MELHYEFEPSSTAPATARRAIERELSGTLNQEALDALKLIVSELVTNSVVHGPGRPIRIDLEVEGDGIVRGEVADEGEGVIEIRNETSDGPGGLGLRLVAALSQRWGVYEGSTHVWFELPAAA